VALTIEDAAAAAAPLAAVVRSNIRAEMARRDIKPQALVPILGVTKSSAYRRLDEKDPVEFTLTEIDLVAAAFRISTDVLTRRPQLLD
jgi:hypothetical protein